MVKHYCNRMNAPRGQNPFRSGGFLPQGLLRRAGKESLPFAQLPPFLRALLVTDGTVTKILEAYYWESIEVCTLEQGFVAVEQPMPWIQVVPGDSVLIRKAQLRGQESQRIYANAFSAIRTQYIPEQFRQQLIDREIGIGVLIRDSGLESYREVLEVGLEGEASAARVFRTYRIFIGKKPIILITESFPLALYGFDAEGGKKLQTPPR